MIGPKLTMRNDPMNNTQYMFGQNIQWEMIQWTIHNTCLAKIDNERWSNEQYMFGQEINNVWLI